MRTLAVVVTHNRRELLSRCLDSLQSQKEAHADLLVVNNASTDGTLEMLAARGVDVVTQENVGSAGGWHRGIHEAQDRGYEAVWLMDDDGYPGPGALAVLIGEMAPGVACVSSVVLREDSVERFVFPFPKLDAAGLPTLLAIPRKIATLDALHAVSGARTYPFAHLFNGALVSMSAVREIGNVNRDFFIFGDEVDYFFRLRQAGKVLSALGAHHYHPDVTRRPYSPAKIYYYVKNTLILNHRYFNWPWLRDALTVAVAIARTFRRNGLLAGSSYLLGRNAAVLARAVQRGLTGSIGRDFND